MDIVKEAKEWLGTPFMHGQAVKGVGADCVQFPIALMKSAGKLPAEFKSIRYNQDWALHNEKSELLPQLEKYCIRIDNLDNLQSGDLLAYKYGKCVSHLGVYIGEGMIIHAVIRHGVTLSYMRDIANKFHSAWRVNSE